MNKKSILILSVIISIGIIIIVLGLLFRNKSDYNSFVDNNDKLSAEDLYDYQQEVPDAILNSSAWQQFTMSEYYSIEQQYNFKVAEDRIVSEYYGDYFIYIEYVMDEVVIDVNDIDTMDTIVRFE